MDFPPRERAEHSGLDNVPSEDGTKLAVRVFGRQGTQTPVMAKVHVFGHCLGTIPAALFATAHPELVESLILASSGIYTKIGVNLFLASLPATHRVLMFFHNYRF